MAPHSSTLAWKIPWMEEPGRLQSMGSQSARHDWACMQTDSTTEEKLVLSPPSAPSMQKHSSHHPILFLLLLLTLFLAVLGLCCCTRACSSCGELGTTLQLLCADFSSPWLLFGAWALGCGLSSYGTWDQLPHGMWDIPGLGLNSCPPHRQMDSQPLDHQGSPTLFS